MGFKITKMPFFSGVKKKFANSPITVDKNFPNDEEVITRVPNTSSVKISNK